MHRFQLITKFLSPHSALALLLFSADAMRHSDYMNGTFTNTVVSLINLFRLDAFRV